MKAAGHIEALVSEAEGADVAAFDAMAARLRAAVLSAAVEEERGHPAMVLPAAKAWAGEAAGQPWPARREVFLERARARLDLVQVGTRKLRLGVEGGRSSKHPRKRFGCLDTDPCAGYVGLHPSTCRTRPWLRQAPPAAAP